MGDHDNGATVRLAATIARGCYDVDGGTMIADVHPETIVEMALAAKREVDCLRAELAEAHREIARCHERLEITHTYDGLTGAVIPTPMEKRATAIDGIEARDCTIQLVEEALAEALDERDAAIRERDVLAHEAKVLRESSARAWAVADAAIRERDARPEITPEDADLWRIASIEEYPTPECYDAAIRVESALRVHARKVKP